MDIKQQALVNVMYDTANESDWICSPCSNFYSCNIFSYCNVTAFDIYRMTIVWNLVSSQLISI